MDAVLVLADGIWQDDAQARELARSAGFVIAADGGFAQALRARVRVDLVVGDLDSLGHRKSRVEELAKVEVHAHPPAKDASDLELALEEAIARRPRRVLVLGGLGLRIDHALTNVHLLERGLDAGVEIRLVDGPQSVILASGRREIEGATAGDRVSLIPLSRVVRVSTTGLRYPLHAEELARSSSRGISNEVESLPAEVHVSKGRLLVIHTRSAQ